MPLEKQTFEVEFLQWNEDMIDAHLKLFYIESRKMLKGGNRQFDSITHYCKSAETGKVFGLPGKGNLNWFIEKTSKECDGKRFYFELEYKGRDESKAAQFGGKAPYSFEYWLDRANGKIRLDPADGGEQGEIEYKEAAEVEQPAQPSPKQAPPLAKPEQPAAASAPAQPTQEPVAAAAAPAASPAAPAEPKKKRVF